MIAKHSDIELVVAEEQILSVDRRMQEMGPKLLALFVGSYINKTTIAQIQDRIERYVYPYMPKYPPHTIVIVSAQGSLSWNFNFDVSELTANQQRRFWKAIGRLAPPIDFSKLAR